MTIALHDPTLETYWALRQVLAWLLRRDTNDVKECTVVAGDISRWPRKIGVDCGKHELNQKGLNQAFTALRHEIESGALVINGFVTAENKRRDITPIECLDLHLEWRLELASFATARVATPYIEPAIRDLRVRRVDVLRTFPENVAVEKIAGRPESDEASASSTETAAKHPGGAPPKYDWNAAEVALEAECGLQASVPRRDHSDPTWRTKNDAYRCVLEHFARSDGGPSASRLKQKVGPMLKRIAANLSKDKNSQ